MNRGTVMEINGGSAVLLTPDGQFVRVKAYPGIGIGQEIPWTAADLMSGRTGTAARRRRWISSGAFAAVLFILVVALLSFRTPPVVAYVSMDVNPSVELGLDAKERVRELRAVNPDAAALIEGVSYRGQPVESVMRILAQKLAASHILTPDGGEIVIASVRLRTVDEQWETQVTEKIKEVLQKAASGTDSPVTTASKLTIETVFLPVEVRKEAERHGISAGKMAFWVAAENSGHEVDLKELQEKSVRKVASPLGGLKQVLEESHIDKEDKESWKRLLAQAKDNSKKQEKKDVKENGEPSDDKQNGEKQNSDKKKDDKKNDDKKKDVKGNFRENGPKNTGNKSGGGQEDRVKDRSQDRSEDQKKDDNEKEDGRQSDEKDGGRQKDKEKEKDRGKDREKEKDKDRDRNRDQDQEHD